MSLLAPYILFPAVAGFSDDFEGRTEDIEASADYSIIQGSMAVASGAATLDTSGETKISIDNTNAQIADGTWTAIMTNGLDVCALRIRYQDANNWVTVKFELNGYITVEKLVASSYTNVNSQDRNADMSGGASETCIVEFNGSTIDARWTGGTNVSGTVTDLQTETGKSAAFNDYQNGNDQGILEWSIVP